MRIAHTADLHIGKRLYDVSMLEEQKKIFAQITDILKKHKAEGLIVAGDIYDKPSPSAEAVKIFDDFITDLKDAGIKLFAVSGNHDSMEKVSYGSRIMSREGIYFQENFQNGAQKIRLEDKYGELNIYMVPFIKPVYVGKESYEEAFIKIINDTDVDYANRNILVAHQFITGAPIGNNYREDELEKLGFMPERSESESVNVGGLDNISYQVVEKFDYVALGHLHRRQSIGKEYIRYSGSPMKYSFSESLDSKSIEIIDIKEKGNITIETVALEMPRDVRVIKGTLEELTSKEVVFAEGVNREDYICAVITDEERVIDGANKLLRWYPNLLTIQYNRDMAVKEEYNITGIKGKNPLQLFSEYYEFMNNKPMSREEEDIIKSILGGELNET